MIRNCSGSNSVHATDLFEQYPKLPRTRQKIRPGLRLIMFPPRLLPKVNFIEDLQIRISLATGLEIEPKFLRDACIEIGFLINNTDDEQRLAVRLVRKGSLNDIAQKYGLRSLILEGVCTGLNATAHHGKELKNLHFDYESEHENEEGSYFSGPKFYAVRGAA